MGLRAGAVKHDNFKIAAYALVQAGVDMVSACRGGCALGIVSQIFSLTRGADRKICAELSINEKCAFEAAYGAASLGIKAACVLGKDGLNAAFAPLVRALEKPIDGGLVIMVIDDRGENNRCGERDIGLMASLFGISVYGPVSSKMMNETVLDAVTSSVKQRKPIIIECGQEFSWTRARRSSVPLLSEMGNAFPHVLFLNEGPRYSLHGGSEEGCDVPLMSEPVAFAAGLFDVLSQDRCPLQIVVSMEDLTFFGYCLATLTDAVRKHKKFTLVVADGGAYPLAVESALAALGISFVRVVDSDDIGATTKAVREAFEYLHEDGSKPAIIVRKCDPAILVEP